MEPGEVKKPRRKRQGWRNAITRALAGGITERAHLLELLREASLRGVISAEDYAMLEGALAVAEMQVRDIMVPRAQMVCVRRDDSLEQILPRVVESGHSRYPVVDGDRDDVQGILLAKDLLRAVASGGLDDGARFDMRELLRPAVFVPEAKRLNVLLKDFRVNRNHMALVVDEYGGVAGLVTIEDVIEQIVGDIDDEYDVEEELNIRPDGEQHFLVRGSTPIEEFNEHFQARLPDGEFETVAGMVMQQLGRVPRRGESVVIAGWEFRVQRTDRRRIDSLRVCTAAAGAAAGGAQPRGP
jgi:magnesium and cobalt transporter